MSLLLPCRLNSDPTVVSNVMQSLGSDAVCLIREGTGFIHMPSEIEVEEIVQGITGCRFIYLFRARTYMEPILGVIGNPKLRRAKIEHYVARQKANEISVTQNAPNTENTTNTENRFHAVSRTNPKFRIDAMEKLGVLIRCMFSEQDWLDSVTVNTDATALDGFLGLAVCHQDQSLITLAEASHRPNSSRRLR